MPDLRDYMSEWDNPREYEDARATFNEDVDKYYEDEERWEVARAGRDQVEAWNQWQEIVASHQNETEFEELFGELDREQKELNNETIPGLVARAEALDEEIAEAASQLSHPTSRELRRDRTLDGFAVELLSSMVARPVTKTVQAVVDSKPREGFGKPKGKPVDTRGLASLRLNYGADASSSSSDSDEDAESDVDDALDFDDSRNEHYSTKPYRGAS